MVLCFTKYLLNERHHLSRIWLAAHFEKKIKKNQVFEVDIVRSVQDILSTEIFFDLRVSGHLLVGIVKIHSRKCKYLLTECNDILCQVKLFRVGTIDLPDNLLTARYTDITLPETFDNLVSLGNDMIDAILSSNQSRVEDITLKETYENLTLLDENDMTDFQFTENAFDEDFIKNYDEEMSVFDENTNSSNLRRETEQNLKNILSDNQVMTANTSSEIDINEPLDVTETTCDLSSQVVPDQSSLCLLNNTVVQSHKGSACNPPVLINQDMNNELYLQSIQQVSSTSTAKKQKKRKLTIDYIRSMSYGMIQKQLLDTSDIISAFELAPATKRLMNLKEIGRAENLFSLPVQKFLNADLSHLYKRHLKVQKVDNDALILEKERKENLYNMKKRPRQENDQECMENDLPMELSDTVPESEERVYSLNIQNDIHTFADASCNSEASNFVINVTEENEYLPPKGIYNLDLSHSDQLQNTQVSKTSDERWECAVQERIFNFLKELRTLLKRGTLVYFSTAVKNKKKIQVSQRFLCLLMLKKLQIVSLQQPELFGDILIHPGAFFDSACSNILKI